MTADERDELQTLHERVRILEAALGLGEEFDAMAEVRRLAAEGRRVRAIRLLREHTRLSLVAAKRVVDALQS
jgi:ribosomal protein L7/L12